MGSNIHLWNSVGLKRVKFCESKHEMKYLLLKWHLLSLPEQSRRGLRRDQASRRMVALYDYDPRESSPNVDVEVSLTVEDRLLNSSQRTVAHKIMLT